MCRQAGFDSRRFPSHALRATLNGVEATPPFRCSLREHWIGLGILNGVDFRIRLRLQKSRDVADHAERTLREATLDERQLVDGAQAGRAQAGAERIPSREQPL